jgi:phosphomannomutase
LDASLAMRVAAAAAAVLGYTGLGHTGLGHTGGAGRRPLAVVGRDPRASGEFLEAAVVAGLAGRGIDVVRLGVIPTQGVAYLTEVLDADFGVMLSASHNPAPDNGIKFFARGGVKLPDDVEEAIEAALAADAAAADPWGIPAAGFGRVRDAAGEAELYLAHLLSTVGVTRIEVTTTAPDSTVSATPRSATAGANTPGAYPTDSAPVSPAAASSNTRGSATPGSTTPGSATADSSTTDSVTVPATVSPATAGGAPIGVSLAAEASPGPLAGWRVVVDCAHGAAYGLAPRLLSLAGADVIAIGVEPDGININSGCGSTDLSALRAAVLEHRADAGIAYDGDADRCLAVDAAGAVLDGDQILAILALALNESGRLAGGTVVASVMANLGFRLAMGEAGIDVVETPVGDRYLIAAMLDGKYVLGGEQSGHIIMLDHASTGDGMLTSIQLLATAAGSGRSLAELAGVMTRYPQVLVNVHGVDKAKAAGSGQLSTAVAAAQAELGASGRVLVRPSGTEPAVRVMVEAVNSEKARKVADRLAAVVREAG